MDSDDGRLPADSAAGDTGSGDTGAGDSSAGDAASASDAAAAGDAQSDSLPTGWVPLVRNHWFADFMANGLWLGFVFPPVVLVVHMVLNEASVENDVVLSLGFFGLVLVVVLLWYRFRPVPEANFQTNEVRRGRRTVAMSDIRWARLLVLETQKSRSITLQFGTGTLHVGAEALRQGIASYMVRASGGQTPSVERARIVAEVLRRSSIELPETPDDPTGKFTWFNFPGSITREQAIDVVVNPPAFGDPVPVQSNHMYDPPRPGSTRPRSTRPGAKK